ncbi:hypothetical protein [Nocardioides sp.]|uniref:hypothetical protein n=1 Tax=Nocardioides sp. TaxID=35761 RepID=UPI003566FAC7
MNGPPTATEPKLTPEPHSRLTRRRVIRTAGTAAWAAPVIVAATAAPAMASSTGAPAVAASNVQGVRRTTGDTQKIDVEVTFTNNGTADATALSAAVEWILIGMGAANNTITEVSSPWTFSPPDFNLGHRAVFARAGGLAASASDTLKFTFGSASGRGDIVVSPPTTNPNGVNTGSTGVWGETEATDMDVTGISSPLDNGNIFVTFKNNGLLPAVTQSVAVTITPTSGTVAYTSAGNPSGWTASPTLVTATSSPTTITFTSSIPLESGASKSFSFHIDETGAGDLSATVTAPASPNNNTVTGTYL